MEAERALEHWATDEDSLEDQGAVIWRTAQVPSSMSVCHPRELEDTEVLLHPALAVTSKVRCVGSLGELSGVPCATATSCMALLGRLMMSHKVSTKSVE